MVKRERRRGIEKEEDGEEKSRHSLTPISSTVPKVQSRKTICLMDNVSCLKGNREIVNI